MRPGYWLNLLLFGFGLAVFSVAANAYFARTGGDQIRYNQAFQYFLDHKDEFDVVFVGSSYTAVQVDPVVFDDQCARMGLGVRSVNLAMPGATFYKIDDLIRRTLAVSPKRLKYIIMDPRAAEGLFREGEIGTAGAIRWHTPRQTWRAVRRGWKADAPIEARLSSTWHHFTHMLRNLSLIGCGASLRPAAHGPWESAPGRDFNYPEFTGQERISDERDVRRLIRQYRVMDPEEGVAQFDLEALDAQMRLLESHGVAPVFVATPALKIENLGVRELARRGRLPHVLPLDDPESHPCLLKPESRSAADFMHLAPKREVIDTYSRLLAEYFIETVIRGAAPPDAAVPASSRNPSASGETTL